jgi:preprotein translocase subunit SecF
MEHLVSRRKTWYVISLLLLVPGLFSLVVFGLNRGIEFTVGTLWELEFQQDVSSETILEVLEANGITGARVQLAENLNGEPDRVAVIRLRELQQGSAEKDALSAAVTEAVGPFTELQLSSVGSSVSRDITQRSIFAVCLASVGILLYIAYAFRNTQNPVLYGICALVAMVHDVLIVIGLFSILGEISGYEIDSLFVTALLTIIGFSVHDTIVVFDRIRENLARRVAPTFEQVVNYSLAQTVVRSLNTSITVAFTLLALYLFGGETTQQFVLALLVGVVAGTYSSIFNAAQLLVSWENGEVQALWQKITSFGRSNQPVARGGSTQ